MQNKAYIISILIIFSLIISCQVVYDSLFEYASNEYIYVSKEKGKDTNSGGLFDPVATIPVGITRALAENKTKIKIAIAEYKPNDGLASSDTGLTLTTSNITLSGGWNEEFNDQTGYTTLNGNYSVYHVVKAENVNSITLDGFIITGGAATGALLDRNAGGIIFNNVNSSIVTNSIITNNYAIMYGAGIYLYNNSSYNKFYGEISSNYTTDGSSCGGGIYINNGSNNEIYANVLSNYSYFRAGGIYIYSSPSTIISSSTISNNQVSSGNSTYGGGIYIIDSDSSIITNCTIFNNNAETTMTTMLSEGGGIYISNSNSVNITSSTIINNKAKGGDTMSGDGGGIALYISNLTTISNCKISNNIATNTTSSMGQGGGIYFYDSDNCSVNNSEISANSSPGNGAGIYFSISNSNTINNCIVASNSTNTNGGGIYFYDGSSNTIIDSDIVDNSATIEGGGIYIDGDTIGEYYKIESCIITANNSPSAIYIFDLSLTNTPIEIISNKIGSNGTGIGIKEGSMMQNHKVINNAFILSTLQYLYFDIGAGTIYPNISEINSNTINAAATSSNIEI